MRKNLEEFFMELVGAAHIAKQTHSAISAAVECAIKTPKSMESCKLIHAANEKGDDETADKLAEAFMLDLMNDASNLVIKHSKKWNDMSQEEKDNESKN